MSNELITLEGDNQYIVADKEIQDFFNENPEVLGFFVSSAIATTAAKKLYDKYGSAFLKKYGGKVLKNVGGKLKSLFNRRRKRR